MKKESEDKVKKGQAPADKALDGELNEDELENVSGGKAVIWGSQKNVLKNNFS